MNNQLEESDEIELFAEELAEEVIAAAGCFSSSSTIGTATGTASTAGTFACFSC